MNLENLVAYLKESCFVDNPEITLDSEFLALDDKQLEGILYVASFKAKINLNDLSEANLYLLMLIAKKELFYRLATKSAPLYNISSDGGVLARRDRFSHYSQLIQLVEEEYKTYLEELSLDTDTSNTDSYGNDYTHGEIFIASRYHSIRNYTHAKNPVIKLNVDNVYSDKVEISWKLKRINKFSNYILYINNTNNIIDIYNNNEIMEGSEKILSVRDIHKNKFRIENLEPGKIYHLAIVVQEQNGLKGFDEVQFVTEVESEEDGSIGER